MDEDFRKSALAYHRLPRPGKLSVEATKRMANQRDLALAYSPGVAAPCEAIAADRGGPRGQLVEALTLGARRRRSGEQDEQHDRDPEKAHGDGLVARIPRPARTQVGGDQLTETSSRYRKMTG